MTFERELLTMKKNVNIQMHFATWQMITLLCCASYGEKQTLYFSDYYKTITHVQKI